MRLYQIGMGILITLLTVASVATNFPGGFRVSQVLAQMANPQKAEADQLLQQGRQQYQTSQFQAALQSWQQALIIYRQIKDSQGEGKVLGNIGLVYYSLGYYAKAIDYENQWLVIARQIKDRQSEGKALGNLGIVYYSLGDYAKAIDYHQQSLTRAQQIKNYQGEENELGNLGNTYYSLGDYPKAIYYQQQSLTIARQINDLQGEGAALGDIGLVYYSLGDYTKAIDHQQQSLVRARQLKNRQGEGAALSNLGSAYYSLGEYAKAIDYQQQSLEIARQIKDLNSEGKALSNLGLVYLALGDDAKAIDYFQQRLTIARQIKDRQGEGAALNNLGYALYKKGNLALAEKTLFEAITVLECLRGKLKDNEKVSIFERQTNSYTILQQVLIAQNKTDVALEIAERGRARAFVELVASKISPKSQQKSPPPPKIEEIQQIAKIQNSTLVQYSIINAEFKVAGKQQVNESELYIWVIKPTGEVTFRKTDLKPLWQKYHVNLAQLVITSRKSIGVRKAIDVSPNPDVPKAQNQFKRLHELLIKPITDLLPKLDTDRVIFIPQSALFLVPFPALEDEKGKYLIEQHTILTSPSIQILGFTHNHQQKQGSGDALVVGNPTMPYVSAKIGDAPQQLASLPGAEKEANAIAPLLKTQPLIGNQATKTAILQRSQAARIIHLATHGILDDAQGLNSSIALAPSGQDNGLLTASEILDLKLNAELVVLSACDTGRGRVTGDSVIGLSRSLISAGVPSVIVSLWSISDDSTAFLMTQFYQNLQQKLDKAQALRQAMLATMKTHPSPGDWAAFTLIGESE